MKFKFSTFFNLLRALFPKWSFFDQTGFFYEVYFQTADDPLWKYLEFASRHSCTNLFFNPEINRVLAEFSIVERFARETQEASDNRHSEIFKSLIQSKLKQLNVTSEKIQIKIVAKSNEKQPKIIPVYHSPWMPMGEC